MTSESAKGSANVLLKGSLLRDVSPVPRGLETADGVAAKLIDCTAIPTKNGQTPIDCMKAAQVSGTEPDELHARRLQLAVRAKEAMDGLRATVGRDGECRRRPMQAARDVMAEAGGMGHERPSLVAIMAWS